MGENKEMNPFIKVSLNRCCCTNHSACKLFSHISKRSMHFTAEVYAESVEYSCPGLSQTWSYTPKKIQSLFKQQLKSVVSDLLRLGHILRMSMEAPRLAIHGKTKLCRSKVTDLTCGEAEMAELDRIGWTRRVEASCSARSMSKNKKKKKEMDKKRT